MKKYLINWIKTWNWRKCDHCRSIWVYWNRYYDSPCIMSFSKPTYKWEHLCYDCWETTKTGDMVNNGIWFWFLEKYHKNKK